jgi:VWFA-related protein
MAHRLLTSIVIVVAAAALGAGPSQTPAQPGARAGPGSKDSGQALPTFRGGTELVTVDVSVLDRGGRPVQGLRPDDFTVEINGQSRRVLAAELVKADADAPSAAPAAPSGRPGNAPAAARDRGPAGRRVLIAVDQSYIPPGSITPLLNAASTFVDRLTPRDQAAFVVFPEPGPQVDFTSDKEKVRAAMKGLVGQSSRMKFGDFHIGLSEALTIHDREQFLTNVNSPTAEDPPTVAKIMAQDCPGDSDEDTVRCRRQIVAQSSQMAQAIRLDSKISIRTLEAIIRPLAKVEGTKALILISASLTVETRDDLDTLTRLAEAARMSVHTIVVDPDREDKTVSMRPLPAAQPDQFTTETSDRRAAAEGLEELAADGRGGVFRLASNGSGIFDRLAQELSASYVLGVESRPEDANGDFRKVAVSVRRQQVRAHVRQAFLRSAGPSVARSLEESFQNALATPVALTELPLQLATFSQWDPGSNRVRVSLAAEVGQPGIQAGDYVVGYLITDQKQQKVADWSERQTLDVVGRRRAQKPVGGSVLLEPGVYSLQMGIVDESGRRGTVIREMNVRRSVTDDLPASDLIIGNPPAQGQPLVLSVEPRITGGGVAAYLELYSAAPADLDWTLVTFEIAQDADGSALVSEAADMIDGALPSWRVATAVMDGAALLAGRYVARARVVRDGKVLGVITRPFVVERAGRQETAEPSPKPDQP